MSDHEDLLGDDLGDHSLADYNLGNDEEEQLLADDYESGASQNVPSSISSYGESLDMVSTDYPVHEIQYRNQPIQYQMQPDTECVVANITVEVPNMPIPDHSTYAPYEPPPVFEPELAVVPTPIPASPLESPQIVPSEMMGPPTDMDDGGPRGRFVSERPPGAQRMPQVRDIPDSLDMVLVAGRGAGGAGGGAAGGAGRGRAVWRSAQFAARYHARAQHHAHYRRHHAHRGNFNQRASFPPHQIRSNPTQMRPDPPQLRPDPPQMRPSPPQMRPSPDNRPELPPPQMGPEISPERPILPNMQMEFRPQFQLPRFQNQFRPMDEPRPNFAPAFERPMFYARPPFLPPMREVGRGVGHMPQVTVRHGARPGLEQEVRMLPVLPPHLPPGGLAGKKVLINPHFKGNFQPPVDGLPIPAYIPTRIQKTPPLSPTLDAKFGPVKDIDDAAEQFIAEQRSALARAANRKFPRRSPQRYIENTTIEIENELAPAAPPRDDDDLLRRQEEFINANRAGLRRRMRSPTPPRRSPSPRRSPERVRPRLDPARPPVSDEDMEYRRRMREQDSLRERVLRAKEARRRKHAAHAAHAAQAHDRERDRIEKESAKPKPRADIDKPPSIEPAPRPDTTRKSPEKPASANKPGRAAERDRSPLTNEEAEVNSTCENLTPPREELKPSPERDLTPPLPEDKALESDDDDLDLILDDIDGILSDEDDTGRFKEKPKKAEPPKPKPHVDLRAKLPPKLSDAKRPPRQKIVFHDKDTDKEDKKKKEKSPPAPRRPAVTSAKVENTKAVEKKPPKTKGKKSEFKKATKDNASRQRIIFDEEELEKEKDESSKPQFSNRRVILQRKISQQTKEKSVLTRIEVKTDPTKPNPGIFSRAVRTAIGGENHRIVIKKEEPQIEYESGSDIDEDKLLEEDVGNLAVVTNLPHGMTDTRLKTLAGNDVQSLTLHKEERSAKITFKTTVAAQGFKKKFNNKMIAASRLSVALR